mmetsp:Transcript_55761/g.145017  ORF Transcript_55761/g.145017 Transcript_55761/m.145017 type:complete len:102 (-) Transcript_55761:100-405(-)
MLAMCGGGTSVRWNVNCGGWPLCGNGIPKNGCIGGLGPGTPAGPGATPRGLGGPPHGPPPGGGECGPQAPAAGTPAPGGGPKSDTPCSCGATIEGSGTGSG